MSRPFEPLPKATRLFDAIKFKTEEARLAFYFALSDTIFCEDSDLGMDYSMKNEHQRRRVVCKNKNKGGFIIYEMNGLMVGSIPKRNGFEQKAAIKGKKNNENNGQEMEAVKKSLIDKI